jgi:hypothetical protein
VEEKHHKTPQKPQNTTKPLLLRPTAFERLLKVFASAVSVTISSGFKANLGYTRVATFNAC